MRFLSNTAANDVWKTSPAYSAEFLTLFHHENSFFAWTFLNWLVYNSIADNIFISAVDCCHERVLFFIGSYGQSG